MILKRYNVKVIPRASQNSVEMLKDGSLKVKLTTAPQDGKANEALRELLAAYFKVKKSTLSITVGKKSRNKIVQID